MKPIVYAAALESGLDPCAYYDNTQKTYPQYDNWSLEILKEGMAGQYSLLEHWQNH